MNRKICIYEISHVFFFMKHLLSSVLLSFNVSLQSFFASIKKEDFRKNFYKTEAEFNIAVSKYIDFYNDYRPHQRLGYLTPNQAEDEFYKSESGGDGTWWK